AGEHPGQALVEATDQQVGPRQAGFRRCRQRRRHRQFRQQGGEALQLDGIGAAGGKGGLEPGDDERQPRRRRDVAAAEAGGLGGQAGAELGQPAAQRRDLVLGGRQLVLDAGDAAIEAGHGGFDRGQAVGKGGGVGRGGAGGGRVHAAFERLHLPRNVVQFGVHRRRYTRPQLLQRSAQRRKTTVELLDGGVEAELGVDGPLLEGGQALFECRVALPERRQPWFGVGNRRGRGQRQ